MCRKCYGVYIFVIFTDKSCPMCRKCYGVYIFVILQISLAQCVESVMVFANSHLMMSSRNNLSVIAAHTNKRYVMNKGRKNNRTGLHKPQLNLSMII